jgi:hypothetical protein
MNHSTPSSSSSPFRLEGATIVGPDGVRIGSIESAALDRTGGALSHVVICVRRFGFVAVRYMLP